MDPIHYLQEFIEETKVAIKVFEIKKTEIEQHHNKCNISRTIGTSVSTAGAGLLIGALVLAPFTGGTSIVAATGLGTALGIGGAAVSIGTEAVDFFASKTFTEQMIEIFEKRNKTGEKLNEYFQDIEKVCEILIKDGMNEDEAAANAAYLVLKRGINGANALRFHNLNSLIYASSGFNLATRAGGQFWRSMRLQSLGIRKILSNLGVNVSRKAAMKLVRTGTVILSSIFVYFDVKSLIESWQSKHPTIAQVEELLENMRNQLKDLEQLDDWLKKIPNEKFNDESN
ncbi:unnamed protein product [Brachionus calyciflorus]|uniref:Uncharacterized protein n=1 Tax=Brachionus calyciflorus TaxID=104777 RepID=A0A814BG05_9BILA|nr:unnamed protein product [Brachionus calyciflorus]